MFLKRIKSESKNFPKTSTYFERFHPEFYDYLLNPNKLRLFDLKLHLTHPPGIT